MKTLVYCTSFAASPQSWQTRYALWIDSVRRSGLAFDQLLIVDDASPYLPDWSDAEIVHEHDAPDPTDVISHSPVLIYRHDRQLGRIDVLDFPGWHRSFAFGARYAEAHGFERVVHLESDAHIISPRLGRHFNHIESGWLVLWSRKYAFPEMAIQVAAGPQVAEMAAFARRPYTELIGRVHECALPYTHAELLYVGDRYGESLDHVPADADFSSQVLSNQGLGYCWWLEGQRTPPPPSASPASFRIGLAELDDHHLFDNYWSGNEITHRWMLEYDSRIYLPRTVGAQVLSLKLYPFTIEGILPFQWLIVMLNEHLVGEFHVYRQTRVFCDIPANLVRPDQVNVLRLVHPSAALVSVADPNTMDTRRLSFALQALEMQAP